MTDGFDPADPPGTADTLSRFQSAAVEMYEKLLNRGDTETAEELREIHSATEQARFIRQQVVEFDPKYDEDTDNSAKMAVKNTYDALVELGYDDHAEKLRDFNSANAQKRYAIFEINPSIDAEIDPMTGEFEPADPPDQAPKTNESGV